MIDPESLTLETISAIVHSWTKKYADLREALAESVREQTRLIDARVKVERERDSLRRERDALAALVEALGAPLPPCSKCGGSRYVYERPTIYITDSDEEIALANEMAWHPCWSCRSKPASSPRPPVYLIIDTQPDTAIGMTSEQLADLGGTLFEPCVPEDAK